MAGSSSSLLHLKSRMEGTHIFSAGVFTFKPRKQPKLCSQESSLQNSRKLHSRETSTFPSRVEDPTMPDLPPPLGQTHPPSLPLLPKLPPLPELPSLPPLPRLPNLPPMPGFAAETKLGDPDKLTNPQFVVPTTPRFPSKQFRPPPFFPFPPNSLRPPTAPLTPFSPNPFRPPLTPFSPNPFRPPLTPFAPNPFQPPLTPFAPNPFQPPMIPLPPSPFQTPSTPLTPLPPMTGLTPPSALPFPPTGPGIPPASSSSKTSSP